MLRGLWKLGELLGGSGLLLRACTGENLPYPALPKVLLQSPCLVTALLSQESLGTLLNFCLILVLGWSPATAAEITYLESAAGKIDFERLRGKQMHLLH